MDRHLSLVISGTLLALLVNGCVGQQGHTPGAQAPAAGLAIRDGRFAAPERDLPLQEVNLQRLINNAADGKVVEVPFGRYVLATSLTLARRSNLHLAFVPGTQLRIESTEVAVIRIEACKNVKISGVRARHVKPLAEYECHGPVMLIKGSTDICIDNCELNGCGAVGVSAWQSSVEVTNCHIHHNTWNAFYLHGCGEVSVIGNIIEDNANTLQAWGGAGEIMWSDNLVRNNGGYWQKPRKPGLKSGREPDLTPPTAE